MHVKKTRLSALPAACGPALAPVFVVDLVWRIAVSVAHLFGLAGGAPFLLADGLPADWRWVDVGRLARQGRLAGVSF